MSLKSVNVHPLCKLKIRRLIYSFCILFLIYTPIDAQSKRVLKFRADEAIAIKDWYSASQYYSKLYARDSSNLDIKYSYAETSRLSYDLGVALTIHISVTATDKNLKYPLSVYWVAQLLKNKQQYKEAKKWFMRFSKLEIDKNDYEYYFKKAQLEIEACDLAQNLVKNPIKIKTEHLSQSINTKASEYAAFEKDSTIYFSTLVSDKYDDKKAGYSKIYSGQLRNKKWRKVRALDTLINNPRLHSANACLSPDSKTMIITQCEALNASEYRCDLYKSTFDGKKWLMASKLPAPINLPNINTTQPNYGWLNDKQVLYFSSNRSGGFGGLDIWYSFITDSGTFETPINVGSMINTPDDEVSPWYNSFDTLLYFSSTYHKGLGAFDVFKTKPTATKFGEPTNLGFPINSSHNDLYYSINNQNTKTYLASNRTGSYFDGKQNCCSDIYKFNIDTIVHKKPTAPPPPIDTLKVAIDQLKLLVPLTLYFHNDEPNPKSKSIVTNRSYETTYNEYKLLIPTYQNEFSKGLKPSEKDAAITAINTFFSDSLDGGIEDLRRFSDMLEKVLLKGETVKITFKGYCSPLASTDYNINLAKRRISSLRNYFSETKNGVFIKYINNQNENEGKIIFEDVDVGELPISSASDDLKDKRNSVYSPNAAKERKIQILAISFGSTN